MDDAVSYGEILRPGFELVPFMKTSKNEIPFGGQIPGWVKKAAVGCCEYIMLVNHGSTAAMPRCGTGSA